MPGIDERDTPSTRGRRNEREVRRLKESPCNRPPARPDPPTVTFRVREAMTHLEFTGKIKWDEGELDTSGHPLTVVDYEIEYRARDTATGDLVDLEDGKSRIRVKRKAPPARVALKRAEIVTGTIAEFETRQDHNLEVGDTFEVKGVTPAGYNGEWIATVVSDNVTVRANIGTSPAEATKFGRIVDAMDSFAIIIEHVPRPRTYEWEARRRDRSSEGCWSRWSAWSVPVLPWSGADPQPPAPALLSYVLDRIGGRKGDAWRGKLRLDPVRDWDVPGGDQEDDVAGYFWLVQVSENGGSTWHRHRKGFVADHDDDAGDDIIEIVHQGVRPRNRYRAFAETQDRYGRRGPRTGPYPSAAGIAVTDSIGVVSSVAVKHIGPLEWRIKWTEPSDRTDVDRYRVDVFVAGVFYESVYTRAPHLHYKGDQSNKGTAHRFDVFALDEDDNLGTAAASPSQADTATIDGDDITPGSINLTPFASSIRPVAIVSSLPTLPDSLYPVGSFVYRTTDGGLYKNVAGSWMNQAAAAGLVGTITETQIADGAISTPKLQANAVTANEIAANSITSSELASASVIAGKIAAGAVSATEISVSALSAISANIGTVTAGTVKGISIEAAFFTTFDTGDTEWIVIAGDSRIAGAHDSIEFVSSGSSTKMSAVAGGIKLAGAASGKLGFWGATPQTQRTVTGTRSGGTALTDLLQKLESIGIIDDQTT